jgi:RNA polymerase sporulation-specific sigma factor
MVSTGDARNSPAPTPMSERRLIEKSKRGDRVAQAELLRLYEPLVRRIARTLYLPGGEREDLAQCARVGIIDAARSWDPGRRVPFRSFAWPCAVREARMAVNSARSGKHQSLNGARPLDDTGGDRLPLAEMLEATGRPDEDPVAKALAREQLNAILERARTLTPLERRSLALSASDYGHREIAARLGVRPRAVNNALPRARRKLLGRGAR